MSKLTDLVRQHVGPKGPIVLLYKDKNEETGVTQEIYMIKSISRVNQSYNIVEDNGKWVCDCPSFKYRSGVDKDGHCKHCLLVSFLLSNHVNIEEI